MCTIRTAAVAALAGLSASWADLPAQVRPDTLPADTTAGFPRAFQVRGVTVRVPRTATDAGGVGAVEVRTDSMSVGPAPTLEDVLRELPLIQIRENSRGEAQPALRGAEDRQIAVLVDGVPLTLGWDHRTDLSVIPVTAARSIHLLRGLSSVLHGPNVLGGVVEIDVARGDDALPPPPALQLSAALDETGGATLSATAGRLTETGGGQWMLRGGVGYRQRDGVTLPDLVLDDTEARALLSADGHLRLNSDFRHLDGFVATRYRGEDGRWLALTASAYDTDRGVPPETHESSPRLWRYPNQSRLVAAFSGGTGIRETRLGEGDLEASLGVDVGSFRIDQYETPAFDAVDEVEEGDDRTITLRLLGDHTLGTGADLRGAFTYGDVSHDELLTPGGSFGYRQRLWSLGSEVELRFGDPGWIPGIGSGRLNVGVVVDGADTPESGDKPALGQLWDWGARLGVTAAGPGERLLFHGGVSRRARFPSLRELYSGALGRFLPNPSLRPEVLTGGELGLTWRSDRHEVQLVGFRQVLSHGIIRISVDTPDGTLRQRVNQDRIQSSGIELLGSGRAGPISYAGDLTLQKVWLFDDTTGERRRPEYEPEWAGKLNVAVPLGMGVTGGVEGRFTGVQYCLDVEGGGLGRLDQNRQLDLEARRIFRLGGSGPLQNVDALVSVANVTDRAVFDQCGLPQPGRTLRAQVRIF